MDTQSPSLLEELARRRAVELSLQVDIARLRAEIARLAADNYRLQGEVNRLMAVLSRFSAETSRLRAENDGWRGQAVAGSVVPPGFPPGEPIPPVAGPGRGQPSDTTTGRSAFLISKHHDSERRNQRRRQQAAHAPVTPSRAPRGQAPPPRGGGAQLNPAAEPFTSSAARANTSEGAAHASASAVFTDTRVSAETPERGMGSPFVRGGPQDFLWNGDEQSYY
ncbi:hypothetical protein B0T24DRAFT_592658 [Lasiosphaeria ovina]|uniref:Uncharacterized protein n=1 Tax=Lasiosphaeria ovina TaxID=92902 RepID=A0AAE0KIR7_9PEZI|nr:hypothetical protein B0T24DRAFT_592658 [Lasiosphaeria ovina]